MYKSLLHSPCNGTNGIPLHALRSPCSQALVHLSCRIASVVRVSERSWYHMPLSTNNTVLFADDFNDVHRFRGGCARAGTSALPFRMLAWYIQRLSFRRAPFQQRSMTESNPIISEWSPTTWWRKFHGMIASRATTRTEPAVVLRCLHFRSGTWTDGTSTRTWSVYVALMSRPSSSAKSRHDNSNSARDRIARQVLSATRAWIRNSSATSGNELCLLPATSHVTQVT